MDIPIFPLPLVLFPQIVLPLHIFEERYKLMINRCIDESSVFGIVFIPAGSAEDESSIRRVGVTAKIVQHERLDDGRLNIMAAGVRRFRIKRFIGSIPYWTGNIDFFEEDSENTDDLLEAYNETVRLFREASRLSAQLRGVEFDEIKVSESPELLSYTVSYVLGVDNEAQQELLEMTSTSGRLKSLAMYLEEACQRLRGRVAREDIEPKVKGNGHLGFPGKKTP